MQKYGFFFILVVAILNVLKMAARGDGLKCFHQKHFFIWSMVFVGKEPTFYPDVHFYGLSVY